MASGAVAVRQLFAQALARRAAALQGAARERVLARLAALRDVQPTPQPMADARPRPLAELVAAFAPASGDGVPELRTLRDFRAGWQRLGVQNRLAVSAARVPANAGPLNSQGLAWRLLQRLDGLSPAYLLHVVAHLDALAALEVPEPALVAAKRRRVDPASR